MISVNIMPLKGDPSSTAKKVTPQCRDPGFDHWKSAWRIASSNGRPNPPSSPYFNRSLSPLPQSSPHSPIWDSLNGWVTPLECIVICIMIIAITIQQIAWEAQPLKDALRKGSSRDQEGQALNWRWALSSAGGLPERSSQGSAAWNGYICPGIVALAFHCTHNTRSNTTINGAITCLDIKRAVGHHSLAYGFKFE